ncbi:MAG TPA: hypothetical protein VFT27_09210, partial [Actinomycetota bacterium]|nr:hypothetical protein [Actinomycetota bacterium]
MSVDPGSGTVYLLDAAGPRIVRLEPAADGSLEQGSVSELDLRGAVSGPVRGLALDPASGHLFLRSGQSLLELSGAGAPLRSYDLSASGLQDPQALAFAPSGDRTDDPAALSLYVADSGGGARQSSGQIVELSLSVQATATPPIDFSSVLVTTVNMAGLNPPSPDTSGITYVAGSDRLVISDGEVEETVNGITHFQGANVWELNRTGLTLARTANISNVPPTVVPMTNEPTGVAYNPANGHYYFSDDGQRKIFDLNPGADGLVGTTGDSWSSFDTSASGNGDPEGVAYDTFGGHLFVADGLNREIYEYTSQGALVGHFDTAQWGVEDPESVEFNPVSGTLFILSDRSNTLPPAPIIVETTTSGTLLQTIDASASGAFKPAGLAYAPASDGTASKRFYIVDRGVDNNADPNAVDGKLYELTAPQPSAPANEPPTVSAGPDLSATLPASVSLDGTVTDDGKPNPPATVTATWTQVGGPGVLSFGNANAVDTSASASVAGVYTARLTASDSQFSASDEATLTFSGTGSASSLDVRVPGGPSDAEERPDHSVALGSTDLDMMTQDESNLLVGTRFTGVTVPQGATITNAYVQFTADRADSVSTSLTIRGQAADNPGLFTTTASDLSARPTTSASASWSPAAWLAAGDAGLAQRTSNLAPVVQEIVGRSGWASGNALVLLVSGSGTRVARSFNTLSGTNAPLLHLEWTAGGGNAAPVITSGGGGASASLSAAENQTFATDVDAVDATSDPLTYSIAGGADAARFSINSGTGVVSFVSAPNFEVPTDAGQNNVYDLIVSVSDGNGGSDSQAIAVSVLNVNEFNPV